jgi:hypothetical protein
VSGLRLIHEVDRRMRVLDGDVELVTYEYRPDTPQYESPKPYLHPIRTRSGDVVSLFRPHDHVWHKGIAWSLPVVGDDNFWGGPTFVPGKFYVQLPNNGRQEPVGTLDTSVDGDRASFAHELHWITEDGRRIFEEHRRLGATVLGADAWALTFETTMRNVSDETIPIGSPTTRGRENAGYGGLFWRGPRSFTGGTILSPDGPGGEELRGTRHPWLGFEGKHDVSGTSSTVVFVDDQQNPQHPPQWFTRTEEFACLCPAPFFSEELEIAAGESVTFRYAVGIADGAGDGLAADLASRLRGLLA